MKIIVPAFFNSVGLIRVGSLILEPSWVPKPSKQIQMALPCFLEESHRGSVWELTWGQALLNLLQLIIGSKLYRSNIFNLLYLP